MTIDTDKLVKLDKLVSGYIPGWLEVESDTMWMNWHGGTVPAEEDPVYKEAQLFGAMAAITLDVLVDIRMTANTVIIELQWGKRLEVIRKRG